MVVGNVRVWTRYVNQDYMACLLHIYSTCARDIQHIKKACKVEARCWKEGLVFWVLVSTWKLEARWKNGYNLGPKISCGFKMNIYEFSYIIESTSSRARSSVCLYLLPWPLTFCSRVLWGPVARTSLNGRRRTSVDNNATCLKWITQAVSTMFYRLNVNSLWWMSVIELSISSIICILFEIDIKSKHHAELYY